MHDYFPCAKLFGNYVNIVVKPYNVIPFHWLSIFLQDAKERQAAKSQDAGVEMVVSESELDRDMNAADSVAHLLDPDCDGKDEVSENRIHLEITTKQTKLDKEAQLNATSI